MCASWLQRRVFIGQIQEMVKLYQSSQRNVLFRTPLSLLSKMSWGRSHRTVKCWGYSWGPCCPSMVKVGAVFTCLAQGCFGLWRRCHAMSSFQDINVKYIKAYLCRCIRDLRVYFLQGKTLLCRSFCLRAANVVVCSSSSYLTCILMSTASICSFCHLIQSPACSSHYQLASKEVDDCPHSLPD